MRSSCKTRITTITAISSGLNSGSFVFLLSQTPSANAAMLSTMPNR